ncbi:MAG: cysteine desulfurase family protein [Candidatus Paceibacterota bacterium]
MRKIYLDNAATTPVGREVVLAMKKYWRKDFGNPSSIHSLGVSTQKAVEKARGEIAGFLNAHAREIIFTSGGTEANNLAIFGTVKKLLKSGKKPEEIHAITTKIEHSSILECFKEIEEMGVKVDYLEVSSEGLVDPKDLRELIKKETAIISIGYANGEIGTVQPVKEIIKEIRHARKEFGRERVDYPYFHTDASQAVQYLNTNVEELGVDLMTLDAQKMYGPKGIGALFVKDNVNISPIVLGGGQEDGMRAGTENVPLIVGFAKAFEISERIKEKEVNRLAELRDGFFDEVKKSTSSVVINGHLENMLPNNINISIPDKDGEFIVLQLDEAGIIASSASACTSGSGESYVVREISSVSGASLEEVDTRAKSTIRFSLGRDIKRRHIRYLLKVLFKICK